MRTSPPPICAQCGVRHDVRAPHPQQETETSELRSKLEGAQGDVRAQLKSKDDKINDILEELASVNALYNEAKDHLEQAKNDGGCLWGPEVGEGEGCVL